MYVKTGDVENNTYVELYASQPEVVNETLATDAVVDTGLDAANSKVTVFDVTNDLAAIWVVEGGTFTAIEVDASFNTAKDNALTINVYIESGTLQIQNKLAAPVAIKLDPTVF